MYKITPCTSSLLKGTTSEQGTRKKKKKKRKEKKRKEKKRKEKEKKTLEESLLLGIFDGLSLIAKLPKLQTCAGFKDRLDEDF